MDNAPDQARRAVEIAQSDCNNLQIVSWFTFHLSLHLLHFTLPSSPKFDSFVCFSGVCRQPNLSCFLFPQGIMCIEGDVQEDTFTYSARVRVSISSNAVPE